MKDKTQASYYGFVKVNKNYKYVTEDSYYQLIRDLSLEHDIGMCCRDGSNPNREKNYKLISKHFGEICKKDICEENACLRFWYIDEMAQKYVSDFLNKYAIHHKECWFEFESNGEGALYYGNEFRFCWKRKLQNQITLEIKVDNIIRLFGTTDDWTIVFSNGLAYRVENGNLTVKNSDRLSHLVTNSDAMESIIDVLKSDNADK